MTSTPYQRSAIVMPKSLNEKMTGSIKQHLYTRISLDYNTRPVPVLFAWETIHF
jgi:hypothetical protein